MISLEERNCRAAVIYASKLELIKSKNNTIAALILYSIMTTHYVRGFKESPTVADSPISHLVQGLFYV